MLLKIGVPKMLATETAIFRNRYFQKTSLTCCYCILLKRLEPEPLVFENIANHSAHFIKNAQSRTYFKCILTRISCGIWNLQYLILPGTKFLCTAPGSLTADWCVRNKVKFIYFDLLLLLFFVIFMKNHHHNTFSYNRHWSLHFKWK